MLIRRAADVTLKERLSALTAITIDAPLHDELFGQVADTNAEGAVLPAVPFTAETVQR